ncbi:MAG: amino acid permease [Candidatus Aminicenantes bacterium]|nr:amino acid permease [Candidatus Aminicenantes bacterium]
MPTQFDQAKPELGSRRLSIFDATMIVSGAIIGAGIFINPAESARYLSSSAQLLLVWVLAGGIAFLGGLCFAELGSLFIHSGGQYLYLKEAFAPWLGFLFGWTLFTTIQTGAIAAVAVTCARFLGSFVAFPEEATVVVAAAIIWFLSLINFLGIKPGSLVQNVFTILKLGALSSLILLGLYFSLFSPRNQISLGPLFPSQLDLSTLNAFGLALMPALFSYGGWQNLNFVAGEVKNPRRGLPIAIILGVSIVVVVYILTNWLYVVALPFETLRTSPRVAAEAIEALLGKKGSRLISLAIVISTFGITNVFILTGARVYQAMAREGAFLSLAARLHPRFQTPYLSIFFQSLWASGLLFSNTYGQLLQYVTFGDWIFFGLTSLALIALRKKYPSLPGVYRVWGFPFVPIIFSLISFTVVINVFISKPRQSLVGLAIILLGLPLYWLSQKKNKKEVQIGS